MRGDILLLFCFFIEVVFHEVFKDEKMSATLNTGLTNDLFRMIHIGHMMAILIILLDRLNQSGFDVLIRVTYHVK